MQGETSNSPEFENLKNEVISLNNRLTNIERLLEKAGIGELILKEKLKLI